MDYVDVTDEGDVEVARRIIGHAGTPVTLRLCTPRNLLCGGFHSELAATPWAQNGLVQREITLVRGPIHHPSKLRTAFSPSWTIPPANQLALSGPTNPLLMGSAPSDAARCPDAVCVPNCEGTVEWVKADGSRAASAASGRGHAASLVAGNLAAADRSPAPAIELPGSPLLPPAKPPCSKSCSPASSENSRCGRHGSVEGAGAWYEAEGLAVVTQPLSAVSTAPTNSSVTSCPTPSSSSSLSPSLPPVKYMEVDVRSVASPHPVGCRLVACGCVSVWVVHIWGIESWV